MIQSIKKQIKLSLGDWAIGLGLTAGFMVFGMIFSRVMLVAGEIELADATLFTVFFGALGAGLFSVGYMGFSLLMNFKLQVGMGCTRKDFIVSYYITGAAGSLVLILFVALVAVVLRMVYAGAYGAENTPDMAPPILKWGIPIAIALPAVSSMCGALVLRFGKIAAWIIWGIWMIGCLGLPNLAEYISEMPDSAAGRAGTGIMSMLRSFSGGTWTILILLAGVVGFAVEAGLLLRQEVRA